MSSSAGSTLTVIAIAVLGLCAQPAHASDPPDPELAAVYSHLKARELEQAREVIRGRVRDGRDGEDFRWSTAVTELAEILKESMHTEGDRFDEILAIATDLVGDDRDRSGFLDMVRNAERIWE